MGYLPMTQSFAENLFLRETVRCRQNCGHCVGSESVPARSPWSFLLYKSRVLWYDFIVNFLKKHGFIHYEVSNFARKGYESKHNIVYWKDQKYLALGAGASGYIKNIRYTNTKNILSYINKEEISEIEYINKEKDFEYYLITNLRLLN